MRREDSTRHNVLLYILSRMQTLCPGRIRFRVLQKTIHSTTHYNNPVYRNVFGNKSLCYHIDRRNISIQLAIGHMDILFR